MIFLAFYLNLIKCCCINQQLRSDEKLYIMHSYENAPPIVYTVAVFLRYRCGLQCGDNLYSELIWRVNIELISSLRTQRQSSKDDFFNVSSIHPKFAEHIGIDFRAYRYILHLFTSNRAWPVIIGPIYQPPRQQKVANSRQRTFVCQNRQYYSPLTY